MLTVTNSLWVKESVFPLITEEFIKLLRTNYDAGVQSIVEQNATSQINDWVKESTKGKIEKIVSK